MNESIELRIVAARQETNQALGPLLELYRGYLQWLARMEVGPRLQRKVDSSDLVQETLLDAFRQFPGFAGTTEGQLVAWLQRILAGKVANTVRHYCNTQGRKIDREIEADLTASLERASEILNRFADKASPSPSVHAQRREQSVLIADALQKLPEDYRQVIVLRHWDDLSFPEIALRMKRTVDSVEKLWIRALSKLKRLMSKGNDAC